MAAVVGTPGVADPTTGTSASTTKSPGAPASVSDGTMLMGMLVVGSAVNPGSTAPNWTVKYNSNAVAPGLTVIAVLWRRSTGTEPTPYSWSTGSGAGQSVAQIWPIEGELASGDPFHSSSDFQRATATANIPTVTITSVPAGATLFYAAASGSARTLSTGPSIGGVPMTRLTPTGAQLYHLFKLEDYAGGSPSVSGLIVSGGNSSQTAGLWAVMQQPPPNQGSTTATYGYTATVTGTMPEADVSEGQATAAYGYTAAATGKRYPRGTVAAAFHFGVTVEGPNPTVEYVEDWADLASVDSVGVTVSGNRLYSAGGTGNRGFTKTFTFPPTGRWRYTQLIYNVDAGLQNPTIKLGISCGTPNQAPIDSDPDAVGLQMQFATRARSTFKGTNLSGVTIQDAQIVGVGPDVDATLLFDITADETAISFSLKDIAAVREVAAFRILRSELAAAGKTVTKIYAFFTDARTTGGSSLSPFILQTGSIGSTATKTVAGQQIEGRGQRVITTKPSDSAPFQWWIATPPNLTDDTPIIIHCPQSLTGDGHDAWTDTRMLSITTAVMNDYIWLSSTDTEDRFGNQVELDNYTALYDWLLDHFGGFNRDVYLFGTSMGTMVAVNLLGRGEIPARAVAVIGFAGGFDWLWNNVTEKRPEIRAAYGVASDGSDLRAKTTGYDPLLDFIDDPDLDGRGFRFFTGPSDAITPTALSNEMSAIALDAGATEADVITASGGHLDASQYQGDDVVDFYERNVSPQQGQVDAAWTYTASATGTRRNRGTATASWNYTSSAAGGRASEGSTTAAWSVTSSATGHTAHRGSTTAAWSFTAAAAGQVTRTGSASAAYSYAATATGHAAIEGEIDAPYHYTATASGQVTRHGTVTGSWGYTASASSDNPHRGSSTSGGYGYTASAQGRVRRRGTATAVCSWTASANGAAHRRGATSATTTWTAATVGVTRQRGTVTANHAWTCNVHGGTGFQVVHRVTFTDNSRRTTFTDRSRATTIREPAR